MTDRQRLDQTTGLRRRPSTDAIPEHKATPAPHPLITLGGQVGNAQVARMLSQRQDAVEEEEQVHAQHDFAQREGEEEEEVQAQHDLAQREGEEEEAQVQAQHDLAQREGEEEEEIQAKPEVGLEGGPISDGLSGRINAQRGSGTPLDNGTRTTMENSFGTSFADVRVHTDAESDALNRSISAKAFTTGSDIFFRKDTSPGNHGLLAHELTHVVQQRAMTHSGPMSVGPAGDSYEQQADAAASEVTSGTAAQAQRQTPEEEAEQAS